MTRHEVGGSGRRGRGGRSSSGSSGASGGGAAVRIAVAVVLVWVVAAFAGIPLAVGLADRVQSLQQDATEQVRRWAAGQERGGREPDPPRGSGRSGGSGDLPEPPAPRPLPDPRGGSAAPPPAGTPSGVVDALDSVVQVLVARCSRSGAGSGFVVGEGRVMTNAHVVQGASRVRVLTRSGERLDARVVQFDPGTDVAVLDVDDLEADALRPAAPAGRGDDAWVAGHPLGGPLRVEEATVAATRAYRGADQETYVLQTRVRPGNSGGPLLDARGDVLGLVFAAAADGDPVGYARTWAAVADEAAQGLAGEDTVSTGSC